MILLPPVTEIALVGVADRGIPNRERIILRCLQRIDTSPFALLVGLHQEAHGQSAVMPAKDHFFWFGSAMLEKDDWILVYTGSGTARKSVLLGTANDPVYLLYWGMSTTIFANSLMVPTLIRFGGVSYTNPPVDMPQFALTNE